MDANGVLANVFDPVNNAIRVSTPTSLFVRKTADESVTSSAVQQNDDDLVLPVAASSTYIFELIVFYDGSTTGDIAYQFTIPASATLTWGVAGLISTTGGASGSVNMSVKTGTSGTSSGAAGSGTKTLLRISGLIRTSTTAGNLQFQWTQAISDGTATTVYTDSYISARKVA